MEKWQHPLLEWFKQDKASQEVEQLTLVSNNSSLLQPGLQCPRLRALTGLTGVRYAEPSNCSCQRFVQESGSNP